MKIFVHNRQTRRRPNVRKLAALARFFLLQATGLKSEGAWAEVSVVLTDDTGIAPVNRTFLDHARATDVITFTLLPMPGGGAGARGEIYLNVQRALEEGARRGNAADELALYLAHGCDHLTGANDRTVRERRRMRRRELLWIKRARRDGLMAGLWAVAEKEQGAFQ
ncbi:MAG: rRNA maturation RNase YbeY [Kiritimatiellaeota bacterium]|nr:rRNA maturation RNase YbeY [Kiritimatiellota bacterium]